MGEQPADLAELRRVVEPQSSGTARTVLGLIDEVGQLRDAVAQAEHNGSEWMARANACRAETIKQITEVERLETIRVRFHKRCSELHGEHRRLSARVAELESELREIASIAARAGVGE